MARQNRPVVHYMATRPDGTVSPTCEHLARYHRARGATVPTVNLAEAIGEVVDHPSPGKKWYDDGPFSYFHMYTRPGEILERVEDGWPIRLFVVEPLGETGNWGEHHYPYWLMSYQIRVVAETEAWRAFGHRGAQTLATIAELPDLARHWTAEWATDPDSTHRTYKAWKERVEDTRALTDWAFWKARYSRRAAALAAADQLAGDAAGQAATDAGAEPDAVDLIRLRARCLAAGQLMFDRLRSDDHEKSIRSLLLGDALKPRALTAA